MAVSHHLLTLGNPLVGEVGMTANALELERPLPPLSIFMGFLAGGPVCLERACTHPCFPVKKLFAPTVRHPVQEGRQSMHQARM